MFGLSPFPFLPPPASLAISLAFLSGCAQTPSAHLPAGAGHFSTVVIDPGHGGKDSGGVSGRRASVFLREKDLTLDTAKRVRAELRSAGLRTVMIREDDHFVGLGQRGKISHPQGAGEVA